MALVTFEIGKDTSEGVLLNVGTIVATPTRRRVDGTISVARSSVSGEFCRAALTFELPSTPLGVAMRIVIESNYAEPIDGYFKIPNVEKINFTELVEVDPETLEAGEPEPEWWAIARATVDSGKVVDDHLILTRTDGVEIDAGNVRGLPGNDGEDGEDGTDGTDGIDGRPGSNGVSVVNTEIDADGDLLVTLSNDQVVNAGHARGLDDNGVSNLIQTPDSETAATLSNTISDSIESSVGTRPEKYGAVGDGVHDDADSIQAWLDAGGTVMGAGNYAISKQLNITFSGVSYDLSSATITPLTADITMIRISGADVSIKANLDGLDIARIGIYAAGDRPTIHDSKIRNFYSPTQTVRGIEVRTYGEPFIVHNNDIRSIGSQPNGGDEFNARAILINSAASTTDYGYITQNTTEDVYGGGAAHIHVIGAVTLPNFEKVLTMIEGNNLTNTSRRFIKIQANGVTATGNTLTQQSTYARPLRPAANIDVITASDIIVSRNIITENPLLSNISCSGSIEVPCNNVVIEGNTAERGASSSSSMITLNRTYGFSVSGNTQMGGGISLSCGNSKNGVVHSNTLISDTSGTIAFNCNTLNEGIVMHSNQVFANRTSPFINSGTGAQTFNNTVIIPA